MKKKILKIFFQPFTTTDWAFRHHWNLGTAWTNHSHLRLWFWLYWFDFWRSVIRLWHLTEHSPRLIVNRCTKLRCCYISTNKFLLHQRILRLHQKDVNQKCLIDKKQAFKNQQNNVCVKFQHLSSIIQQQASDLFHTSKSFIHSKNIKL